MSEQTSATACAAQVDRERAEQMLVQTPSEAVAAGEFDAYWHEDSSVDRLVGTEQELSARPDRSQLRGRIRKVLRRRHAAGQPSRLLELLQNRRPDGEVRPLGQVIAVTGTHGAPGRSTLALALARAFAPVTATVLLDADTYAPALLETIGLDTVDHPTVLDCVDVIEAGGSDVVVQDLLERAKLDDGLMFFAGLSGAHRWRELPAEAFLAFCDALKQLGLTVIVDVSAFIAQTTALTYGPDRDALTRQVCAQADRVVLVGRGDTVGLVRLLRLLDLPDIAALESQIVVNNVSPQASGKGCFRSIRDVLARGGFPDVRIMVADDEVGKAVLYRRKWPDHSVNARVIDDLAVALVQELT